VVAREAARVAVVIDREIAEVVREAARVAGKWLPGMLPE
jgi:hypothetical protein